jgi:hypothetical protein
MQIVITFRVAVEVVAVTAAAVEVNVTVNALIIHQL